MGIGLFLISIATPIASSMIAAKWFTLPAAIGLLPIPLMTGVAYITALWVLSKEEILRAGYGWIVFVCMVVMCLMMALGLAYSIFPDIVIGNLIFGRALPHRITRICPHRNGNRSSHDSDLHSIYL